MTVSVVMATDQPIPTTLEEAFNSYLEIQKISNKLTREKHQNALKPVMQDITSKLNPDERFPMKQVYTLMKKACEEETFSLEETCEALTEMEKYALLLADSPWRKEYRNIKLSSGNLHLRVSGGLLQHVVIFFLLGYVRSEDPADSLELHTIPDVTECHKVAFTVFIAISECMFVASIYNTLEGKYTESQIMQSRMLTKGDFHDVFKHLTSTFPPQEIHIPVREPAENIYETDRRNRSDHQYDSNRIRHIDYGVDRNIRGSVSPRHERRSTYDSSMSMPRLRHSEILGSTRGSGSTSGYTPSSSGYTIASSNINTNATISSYKDFELVDYHDGDGGYPNDQPSTRIGRPAYASSMMNTSDHLHDDPLYKKMSTVNSMPSLSTAQANTTDGHLQAAMRTLQLEPADRDQNTTFNFDVLNETNTNVGSQSPAFTTYRDPNKKDSYTDDITTSPTLKHSQYSQSIGDDVLQKTRSPVVTMPDFHNATASALSKSIDNNIDAIYPVKKPIHYPPKYQSMNHISSGGSVRNKTDEYGALNAPRKYTGTVHGKYTSTIQSDGGSSDDKKEIIYPGASPRSLHTAVGSNGTRSSVTKPEIYPTPRSPAGSVNTNLTTSKSGVKNDIPARKPWSNSSVSNSSVSTGVNDIIPGQKPWVPSGISSSVSRGVKKDNIPGLKPRSATSGSNSSASSGVKKEIIPGQKKISPPQSPGSYNTSYKTGPDKNGTATKTGRKSPTVVSTVGKDTSYAGIRSRGRWTATSGVTSTSSSSSVRRPATVAMMWTCKRCTLENSYANFLCTACDTPRL